MGQQCLPVDAWFVDLARRIAGRHLRRASGVRTRGGRVRRGLPAVGARAFDRAADRVSRAPRIAGALLTPSSLAMIVATFAERERGPAIGTWTAWGPIAGALGPLVAGLILNVASWPWIFVINLPLAVACLWLIQSADPSTGPTDT